MRSPYRRLLVALCMLTATDAIAQTAPALRLTLEEAQARAAAVSHRVAEVQAREAAAQATVISRHVADRPFLSALGGYTRTNHVLEFIVPGPTGVPQVLYPDVPSNYRARLDLVWPVYSGGRTDALERAARAELASVAAEIEVAQADLRLEVARAFWAVVTARAAVEVLEQGIARAQAHVSETRERFNAGLVPPNEVASAEAQESRARMFLIEAQNQRDIAQADLGRLTGVDPLQPIEPIADLAAAPGPQAAEALVVAARESRRERQVLEGRIDVAEQQRLATLSGRRPMVGIIGGVDYARPNPRIFPRRDVWQDSWDIGVNINWLISDGGRIAADAAAAASLATAARRRLDEFDSVLTVEVRQRALEIESGRAAVAAASDTVRAAAEAYRVVTERFRNGVATQTEVLDAQFALLQSELDRTRAQAAIRLAEARLARAIGK